METDVEIFSTMQITKPDIAFIFRTGPADQYIIGPTLILWGGRPFLHFTCPFASEK